jgi:membrane-associated phospholipid phosphatase
MLSCHAWLMQFLTDFGDQAMILPLAVIIAFAWAASGWRRGTIAWCLVVPGTLGVVLVAKLAVFACAGMLPAWDLNSPSGHTASAAVVYGGVVVLLAPRRWQRVSVWCAPIVIAVVIGITRVGLRQHTIADTIAGGLIGVAGAWLLVRVAGPRPRLSPHAFAVLGAALATAIMFHGTRLNAEYRILEVSRIVWPLTLCRR